MCGGGGAGGGGGGDSADDADSAAGVDSSSSISVADAVADATGVAAPSLGETVAAIDAADAAANARAAATGFGTPPGPSNAAFGAPAYGLTIAMANDMARANMDISNPMDRAIARAGSAIGLTPNVAKSTPMGLLATMAPAPVSLAMMATRGLNAMGVPTDAPGTAAGTGSPVGSGLAGGLGPANDAPGGDAFTGLLNPKKEAKPEELAGGIGGTKMTAGAPNYPTYGFGLLDTASPYAGSDYDAVNRAWRNRYLPGGYPYA